MKSSFSGANGCVDVEHALNVDTAEEVFIVTDTKESVTYRGTGGPGRPVPRLVFSRREWDAFVAGVKNGEFDF